MSSWFCIPQYNKEIRYGLSIFYTVLPYPPVQPELQVLFQSEYSGGIVIRRYVPQGCLGPCRYPGRDRLSGSGYPGGRAVARTLDERVCPAGYGIRYDAQYQYKRQPAGESGRACGHPLRVNQCRVLPSWIFPDTRRVDCF